MLQFPEHAYTGVNVYMYTYILSTCITSSPREYNNLYHFNLTHFTTCMGFLGNDTVGYKKVRDHTGGCGLWYKQWKLSCKLLRSLERFDGRSAQLWSAGLGRIATRKSDKAHVL